MRPRTHRLAWSGLLISLLTTNACGGSPPAPTALSHACLEPAEDIGMMLQRGRDRLREQGVTPPRLAALGDSVVRAVGQRTDLRCMPVIDSVVTALSGSGRR